MIKRLTEKFKKIDYDNFENYDPFLFFKFFHIYCGTWPFNKSDYPNYAARKIHHILPSIGITGIFLFLLSSFFSPSVSSEDFIEIVSLLSAVTTAMSRIYFLLLRKPQIYAMIYQTIEMETTGPIQLLSVEECIIINKWRFIQDFLTKLLSMGYFLGGIFYIFPPAFFRKLPFPGYVPEYFYTEWYTRLYIMECTALFISFPAWISLDIYLCIFLCQICKQLEIVYVAAQDLRGKNRAILHTIIWRHNKVLMYGQELCEIVRYIFFAIFCFYGLFLIFGTIGIGEISWKTHGALAIKNVITLIVCLSTLYLICYIGELLQDLSSQIGDGIILDNYAEHGSNRKYLKDLEIMNARCGLSLIIKYTPNMIVNMKLFSNTINYIMSTYIFVNTMFVNPE